MKMVFKNIGVVGALLFLYLYFYQSEHIERVDYKLYDLTMMLENKIQEQEDTFYTVIVDIDERSLKEKGQWPWPRVLDAKLIDKISKMNPSAIGVNILFSEEDRTSPSYMQKFYKQEFNLSMPCSTFPKELKNNDKLLGEVLFKSNATVATYLTDNRYSRDHCDEISYKNNLFKGMKTALEATSLLCNHQEIQSRVKNFGFINAWRDSDRIFRRVPLFMSYKDEVFPSFALATILSFDNYRKTDHSQDSILVKFSKYKPKVFSATDILDGKISANEIQGKIVIIGSSVVGYDTQYTIANGEIISESMIHAFTIDNILLDSFLIQPEIYKKINLIFSFFLSLLILFFFSKKYYLYMVVLIFTILLVTFIWLLNAYSNGVYISLGYLWIPFIYFFTIALIYHIRAITLEKEQQEKFLIKQNKLASMGEMIALIAHQWRQPLSTINGIVLNIDIDQRKDILHAERLDDHLNQIEETTAYLSKTINDFTDFFSQNKVKDTFFIEDVITQAKQLTAHANQKNIQIIYRTEDKIEFTGYRSELIQSLLIILNNAIYACQRNMMNIDSGRIYIDSTLESKKLKLTIEDNGGGVKIKDLNKIFDPYFTTKEAQHGTGLGLYILKLIVEDSMNGKVSVHNVEEGAVFTIVIPTLKKEKSSSFLLK